MPDPMTSGPYADKVTWRVTQQMETQQPGANGRFTKGVNVTFSTSNGLSGTVFVPESSYSADNVRKLIAAKVAAMTSVQNLNG